MNKYKLYLLSLLGLSIVFFITIRICAQYIIKPSMIEIIESQLSSSKREANEFATMIQISMENGNELQDVVDGMNRAISNTHLENAFLCVFDWSGKLVMYPDATKVNSPSEIEQIIAPAVGDIVTAEEFYDFLTTSTMGDENANTSSKIVYIAASDFLVAAHLNVEYFLNSKERLQNRYYTILLIVTLIMVLFSLGIIRLISNFYDGKLEQKNLKLEDGVLNLSKLNASLESYQENLSEIRQMAVQDTESKEVIINESTVKEPSKQRLLTYVRNEMLSIATEEIAYIYVDNTITYVIRKDGKRSTSSESLDQIFSTLNESSFFRANRQIIVAISAIDKIIKFGNSKLKIQVKPESEIDIIIGKNKAAAFKQWLDS